MIEGALPYTLDLSHLGFHVGLRGRVDRQGAKAVQNARKAPKYSQCHRQFHIERKCEDIFGGEGVGRGMRRYKQTPLPIPESLWFEWFRVPATIQLRHLVCQG